MPLLGLSSDGVSASQPPLRSSFAFPPLEAMTPAKPSTFLPVAPSASPPASPPASPGQFRGLGLGSPGTLSSLSPGPLRGLGLGLGSAATGSASTSAGASVGAGGRAAAWLLPSRRLRQEGSVRDVSAVSILVAFKLVRFMVLWIALFFIDRAYQATYMQRVIVEERSPPPLWTVMAAALAVEAAFALLLLGALALLGTRFKRPGNTFVLDAPLMSMLLADYFRTTAVMLAVGTALGACAQSARHFRYGEDGMRGIRALCIALLLVSAVVLAAPLA